MHSKYHEIATDTTKPLHSHLETKRKYRDAIVALVNSNNAEDKLLGLSHMRQIVKDFAKSVPYGHINFVSKLLLEFFFRGNDEDKEIVPLWLIKFASENTICSE
jgi:hypothetical protein